MLAGITSASILLPSANVVFASEKYDLTSYATGALISDSDPDFIVADTESLESGIETMSTVTSYDITENEDTAQYFPEIGDQGSIGSCTAWATTYYQFTYQVNKFRGIETTASNTYSPTWTYNYINCGVDVGAHLYDCYLILKHQGAMTLEDMPYYGTSSEYSFDWSTDIQGMLDALQYRANCYYVTTTSAKNSLSLIKSKIRAGYVLTGITDAYGWEIETNSDGDDVIVRCSEDGAVGSHAVTIVGYDDDFEVTVNGTTLTGAFKIANSWGTSFGNDGYIWVSYDAFFDTSQYDTDWEDDYENERQAVFYEGGNQFYYIVPFLSSVEVCECVAFTTVRPWLFALYGERGTTLSDDSTIWYSRNLDLMKYASTTRYLVFDYADDGGTYLISSLLSSQWTVKMTGGTAEIVFRLVDNMNQTIDTSGDLSMSSSITYTHEISLAKGRISSYDDEDIDSDDIALMQSYLLGSASISSLQYRLADYNEDGYVNGFDLALMRQAVISADSGEVVSIEECICELEEAVSDELEEQNVTFEEFMAGDLAADVEDVAA